MNNYLQSILTSFFKQTKDPDSFSLFDPVPYFQESNIDPENISQSMNAAFLITLAGPNHPIFEKAKVFLDGMEETSEWHDIAEFYKNGIKLIHEDVNNRCDHDPAFKNLLASHAEWMSKDANLNNPEQITEKIWSLFFPEATGISEHKEESIKVLREKRLVTIYRLNESPITEPAGEILLTANALLTIPPLTKPLDDLSISDVLKNRLTDIQKEPQIYWFDHPVQIGVETDKNEIIYGLRGLRDTLMFERERGNASNEQRLKCLLSVSVTHKGLHDIAKSYVEEETAAAADLKGIDVFVFTEKDTDRIIHEILVPAAEHYLQVKDAKENLQVFGVDGEYGRHYSFLKAVAAFWKVFIDPKVKATFKIDLDQIFPENKLVEEIGASAFEHFKTMLWGSMGLDSNGKPVELGMIAGSLVNERDIGKSIYFPDVTYPDRNLSSEEYIFFSSLPQALSTEAEMGTRYGDPGPDGQKTCIQRIHVTGGTNGILIDSLRRHRPFTPSFMGRAEDQAYIMSVLGNPGIKLAYVHKDGLIMRHDKEAFAQEAIQSEHVAKLIGDYVRILYFSVYAGVLKDGIDEIKDFLNPFTGCFISKIPITLVYLRFALKAASFFADGKKSDGLEFIKLGAKRIKKALGFVRGENSELKQIYEKERVGWNLFFDTLSVFETAMENNDSFALELKEAAENLVEECVIRC